ncbi:MAG TPA: hypothetical protein VLG40_03045 [Candidatus Saccharimonas sp.]|nr:hypothetical protein [Candidatus Saccharimonas sp.]
MKLQDLAQIGATPPIEPLVDLNTVYVALQCSNSSRLAMSLIGLDDIAACVTARVQFDGKPCVADVGNGLSRGTPALLLDCGDSTTHRFVLAEGTLDCGWRFSTQMLLLPREGFDEADSDDQDAATYAIMRELGKLTMALYELGDAGFGPEHSS